MVNILVYIDKILKFTGFIGFLISIWLAYHKLFIENHAKLKLVITLDNLIQLDGKLSEPLLFLTSINKGYGPIYLYGVGFRVNNSENIYLGFDDLSNKIPRKLEERDTITFLYPVRKFREINGISHLIIEDGTGKNWSKRFPRKTIKRIFDMDITQGGKFPQHSITIENPYDM